MSDKHQERLDSEASLMTFAQANAKAKALACQGNKVRVVRICDGAFKVKVVIDCTRKHVIDGYNVEFQGAKPPRCGEDY